MNYDVIYKFIHKLLKRELLKNNIPFSFRICKETFVRRRECPNPYMIPYEKVYIKKKKGVKLGNFKVLFRDKLRLFLYGLETSNHRHIFYVKYVFLKGD
jgi:hypothetical protein